MTLHTMTHTLTLQPGQMSLADLRTVWQQAVRVQLSDDAQVGIAASAAAIHAIVHKGDAAYGINTGFGKLAKTRIPDDQLELLQRNLILSHSVGTGEPMSDATVRLVVLMKAASLARGYSGVRPVVIDTLLALLNAGITPRIPVKGSVGASGDLAPLSHMTLALMGEGEVRMNGEWVPAAAALQAAGIAPLTLAAKEGLALINGTQVSTALALHGLFMAERLLEAGTAIGALCVDAAKGSDAPFDPRIHAARGQPGQIAQAAVTRTGDYAIVKFEYEYDFQYGNCSKPVAQRENNKILFDKMKEFMKSDRAKHNMIPPSKFGIIEITRQRVRPETDIQTHETCPTCNGSGEVQASILFAEEIENNLAYLINDRGMRGVTVLVHPYLEAFFKNGLWSRQLQWLFKFKTWIPVRGVTAHHLLQYSFVDKENNEIPL